MGDDKFERLPIFAKPEHYKIYLEPDLVNFTCNGRVDILLHLFQHTDYVKLHFDCRGFRSAKLTLDDGQEWLGLKFELDRKWQTVVIRFPEKTEATKATLTIDFEAAITNGLAGFYRSNYKDKEGNQKVMASTQFESESARLCYPCFDEPEFKATFDVEMLIDEKLTGLSNTNVISEEKRDGKKLLKFATTPIMSTYLTGFVVGELEYIETTFGNIPIRVYTTVGKKEQAHFSLQIAKEAMKFFNEWFDYPSPIPKIDLISVPDFSMGAMEQWGLVTFREILMVHNEMTTHLIKMKSAMVIFHELAHFWFGNLVTMKWWSDLWLKEGFASFCQYVHLNMVHPEFKIMLDCLGDVTSTGLNADEILSSHPIEVEINSPCDLKSYYDHITYSKSNSVIRMLYNYLGEDTFRKGLQSYIKKHAYSNTETQDLWNALSEASGQNVGEIMSTWTKQMGFPLVIVDEEKLGENRRCLKLKQTRYLADGSTDNKLWQIPLTFIKSSSPNVSFHKFLLKQREEEIILDGVEDMEWIKLNWATSGFYRVQYSPNMLGSLLRAIKSNELSVEDRYGLSNDLLALTESGRIPASQFLGFFAELTNEDEYTVWQVINGGVSKIGMLLDRNQPDLKPKFDKFVCQVLEPVSKRLGWTFEKGEDAHRSVLRGLIFGALARAGHRQTIDQMLKLFDEYVGDNTSAVHPEFRKVVFNTAAKHNDNSGAYLMKLYETCNNSEIERDCLIALGITKNEEERKHIFSTGIIGKTFRAQDLYFLFLSADNSSKHQDFAWNWFRNNYPALIERVGCDAANIRLTDCLKLSTCHNSTESFASEFEDFYNSLDENIQKAWTVRYKQSLEQIRNNIKFFKQQQKSIDEFLSGN